jgi:hypothetical protein
LQISNDISVSVAAGIMTGKYAVMIQSIIGHHREVKNDAKKVPRHLGGAD